MLHGSCAADYPWYEGMLQERDCESEQEISRFDINLIHSESSARFSRSKCNLGWSGLSAASLLPHTSGGEALMLSRRAGGNVSVFWGSRKNKAETVLQIISSYNFPAFSNSKLTEWRPSRQRLEPRSQRRTGAGLILTSVVSISWFCHLAQPLSKAATPGFDTSVTGRNPSSSFSQFDKVLCQFDLKDEQSPQRGATNDYFHFWPFSRWVDSFFSWLVFPKARDYVYKRLVLFTTQRYSVCCHRGGNIPEHIHI